ncbi:MAG: hypothetical protein J5662_06440, partial [Clostridia bacterium]|nr:hypothetical protein [Clostridia bacterium]
MRTSFEKLLALIISVCLVAALLALPTVAAVSVWDGASASASLSGSGTADNPYLIKNADDFAYFASQSRGGNYYSGKYVQLDDDISLNNAAISSLGGFNGNFDGKGHEISGINITAASGNQGFFTAINGGTVKNLTLTGSVSSTGNTVGGFAGYITSATFINCVNNLNVTGTHKVGGFCGTVNSGGNAKIISCTNNGNITANTTSVAYSCAGGLIGEIQKSSATSYGTVSILYSQNTGTVASVSKNVIGGFIGQNRGVLTVSNCINSGTVTGGTQIGGIVANVNNDAISLTVKNTINVGTLRTIRTTGATAHIGAILGYFAETANSETFENVFYRDSDCVFNGANNGQTSNTPRGTAKNTASEWTDGTITALLGSAFKQGASYPELANTTLSGSGTKDDPYLISNMSDMRLFSLFTNNSLNFSGEYVKLAADITIDDNSILPLGNFQGKFNGSGHTISGINVSSSAGNVGFFASVTNNGTIRNLTLSGSITSTGDAIGGFAGYVSSASFVNCVNNVNVTGRRVTGGFCGQVSNSGTVEIIYCTNNGNITTTLEASSSAYSVNGGFIGMINSGTIANISLSENTGYVYSPAKNVVGGFVAQCQGTLTVKNCINSGKIEGPTQIGGIVANVAGAPAVTVRNVINVGELKTVRSAGAISCIGGILGYNNSGALSTEETYENAFYRDSDYNYNGASADSSNNTPKGAAKNTASEWTDGTITALLGSAFVQGANLPEIIQIGYSGSGTDDDPYLLTGASDLQSLNRFVLSGFNLENYSFKLTTDLILNENHENYETWGDTAPANNWTPIGTAGTPFAGNLDGAGHSIYGMYCSQPSNTYEVGTGFFGMTYRGTISNLHIKDSYVSAQGAVGGITGRSQEAAFINCSFEGYVFGTTIGDNQGSTGGFMGWADANNTIVKCYTGGTVDANSRSAGIIGRVMGTGNTVTDCYSVANVTGLGNGETLRSGTGGLIGCVDGDSPEFTIENCYFGGTYPGDAATRGPIVAHKGNNATVICNNCYYAADEADGVYGTAVTNNNDLTDGTTVGLLNAGRTEVVWVQGASYPILVLVGDIDRDGAIT